MGERVLRLAWTPRGEHVLRGADGSEVSWRDPAWQPDAQSACITVRATHDRLHVAMPPVWRAQIFLAWREGDLMISTDQRPLALSGPDPRPDTSGVALFLAGGRAGDGLVPALYRGIWQLQPGHSLTARPDGSWRCERTWKPEDAPSFACQPLELATTRLQEHLDEVAVRILDRGDRVACLFSGGLDSSLTTAALLRRAPHRIVLFNVGSALGTAAEFGLRARLLDAYRTDSHPVNLPLHTGLVRALRDTNAVASRPGGTPFSHIFEEIISSAQEHGCDMIVTGDGGDEVFAEREEVLVDLLARRSPALPAAAGFFALRNGERATATVRRAVRRLRTLRSDDAPRCRAEPGDFLLSAGLRAAVADARTARERLDRQLFREGWTYSGLGSYQRAAAVPEWEPISAVAPDFAVASPLVDVAVLEDALSVRRDQLLPPEYWGQRKWLLRRAAMDWLPPEVANHPKIGSADGQILERVRKNELPELLELLSSATARQIGFELPTGADDPGWYLWHGDAWIRAAALVSWFSQANVRPSPRQVSIQASAPSLRTGRPAVAGAPARRAGAWRVAVLAALNVAAQVVPPGRMAPGRAAAASARAKPAAPPDPGVLIDLARRACAVPLVTGSSRVMSRALCWYLRLGRRRPVLMRGVAEGRPGTRYWVEADGVAIDVSGAETPLHADLA